MIVKVYRIWHDQDGWKHSDWHYEVAYDRSDIKKLSERWDDVEVIGKVIGKKIFERRNLTGTTYYVYKCDDGNTYIMKFRIDVGGAWDLTVQSSVPFEQISDFNDAEKAWRKGFLEKYPPNCVFLVP
jgi:hypothetical protein